MKKITKLISFLFCLLVFTTQVKATHLVAADLNYTCLGNNRYEVELTLYRDCGGIVLPQTSNVNVIGAGSCSAVNQFLGLSKISSVEVPMLCIGSSLQTNCNGGTVSGYVQVVYKGVLDLSPYPSGCTFDISYESCCRGNITNLQNSSSSSFYIQTSLINNPTVCNSSPRFANMPVFTACNNTLYNITHSSIEPDGDSLVYSLANPLGQSGSNPIPYQAGFSATNPLNTSSGVSFSTQTGQLSFTPNMANQFAAIDVVVEEYRNGTLIGQTRRVMFAIVTNCTNKALQLNEVFEVVNGTPQSQGTSTTFNACAGEPLHFKVVLSDSNATDSLLYRDVFSSIEQLYPSAVVSQNYPNAGSYDSLIVDVQIPAVRNNTFTMAFSDNACPISNTQSFPFIISPDPNCAIISGRVAVDSNSNCLVSPLENPYINTLVSISKGGFNIYTNPDANGYYSVAVDTGNYTVDVSPLHPYWGSCVTGATANLPIYGGAATIDFPMEPLGYCPLMNVHIGAPRLINCQRNYYVVNYCNTGTDSAVGAYVEVTLDSLFVVDSTTHPIASQVGYTYTFNLGNVGINECGGFRIYGVLDTLCDTVNNGKTFCALAVIHPDTVCFASPLWSGANLVVEAKCQADSVAFRIRNTGAAAMPQQESFSVIEDNIIFHTQPFNLNAATSTPWFKYYADGSTYRMQSPQVPNHPWQRQVSATIAGCLASGTPASALSNGFVNIFSMNDNAPYVSIDCQESRFSWDPNDKSAFPEGYDTPHYIEANTDIEYRIRFQNTGTAPAQHVVIRDTLSPHLDPTTIQFGAYSHNYTWQIRDNAVIEFYFNNINLPDSTNDEPNSHGFIDFRIDQKPNNPIGTVINNQAAIYFDLNPPVITNQTFHTIGDNFIQVITSTEEVETELYKAVKVYPNPFHSSTTIEIVDATDYQDIELSLFDVRGQQIRSIQANNQHKINLERGNLAQGVYLYRIIADGALINSGKVIVK